MASVFTLTEEDLYNFESFCDTKYMDPNCQKYGFFKVILDKQYAGQCSSLNEFYQQFSIGGQKKIRKSVFFSNPNDKNLFGHQNVLPTTSEKDNFLSTSFNPEAFKDSNREKNCCMKVLKEEGQDAFLQHFYSAVSKNAKVKQSNYHDDLKTIQRRAVSKKAAFEKRQTYLKCKSMEGKKRGFEMALAREKIVEISSPECHCESCDLKYCQKLPETGMSYHDHDDHGLLYSAGIEESQTNYLHLTNNFAMAHLCYKNMLSDLDSVFDGVSFPALYLGGSHSVFPLHIEDLSCWSFNFLLHGFPKFWIMIPPSYVGRLTDALQRKGFFSNHRWCRNTLSHKFYIPTPDFFKEENIPFELVIQHENEGIVVLPNTGHAGGNLGPNLAQACNFGTVKWIPYGCVALNCVCMEKSVHADLSDVVAVHAPNLLKAYLQNNMYNVVEDHHFHQSIVVKKKDCPATSSTVCTPPAVTSHSTSKLKRKRIETSSERVKCPVCDVSWAYVQKINMMAHLKKHHALRMNEEIVTKFIEEFSLPNKK